MLERLGLAAGRVIYEERSRNTSENAEFSLAIARPQPGETWLLITSAFHMSRAVGSFRRAGWNVVPYPVDFRPMGTTRRLRRGALAPAWNPLKERFTNGSGLPSIDWRGKLTPCFRPPAGDNRRILWQMDLA